MPARTRRLPAIPGLTERPPSIKSGKSLKGRVKICYRSDLYMKEQQKQVVGLQDQLKQALNDLKTAKLGSLEFHTNRVQQLKAKSDEMIIVLQVCGKINRELAYARRDLLKSVENADDSKIIAKCRKRVQWLENKLEQIIIRNSPTRKEDVNTMQSDANSLNQLSALGDNSYISKSVMSSFPPDVSRLPTAESDARLNTAGTLGSNFQLSINEVIPEQAEFGASTQSTNRLLTGSNYLPLKEEDSGDTSPKSTLQSSKQPIKEPVQPSTADAKLNKMDSRLSFRDPLEDEMPSQAESVSQYIEDMESLASEDDGEEAVDDDSGSSAADQDSTAGSKSRMSAVSSLFTDVTDEEARRTRMTIKKSQESTKSKSKSKPTLENLVTQVSIKLDNTEEQTKDSEAPKVESSDLSDRESLRSTSIDISETEACYDYDSGEDTAAAYWKSEHHRVEFSGLKSFINELDPNSLHQVAISVPGNYVSRPSVERTPELPWREPEDNNDINPQNEYEMKKFREALDSLSRQLIDMQDKVYEAAILSVDNTSSRLLTGATARERFSSVAKAVGRSAVISREMTAMSQHALSSVPPPKEEPNLSTLVHLNFHSKEIPTAKPLPISRVNRNKCFPRNIASFVYPDPDGRTAADRLVNQGKLYNDTQLVIYKPPFRKKKDVDGMAFKESISTPHFMVEDPPSKSQVSLKATGKAALAVDTLQSPRSLSFIRCGTPIHPNHSAEVVDKSKENSRGFNRSLLQRLDLSKPKPYHSGLKWERVKDLFENGLHSPNTDDRIDSARQLGLLQCTDPAVFHALKLAIAEDTEERVQYEAAKALLTLGCLENELLQIAVDYLIVGNEEIKLDVLKCIRGARDIIFINKSMPAFTELVRVLAHLCKNSEPKDLVSFDAAITFGKICERNTEAVEKMLSFLESSKNPHKKATALQILVKQFNESGADLVNQVIAQFTSSPVWDQRREAAQLLQHLGRKHLCPTPEREDLIYSILEQRLWDDSVEMVRMQAAKTLITLDMYARAAEDVIKRLTDFDPSVRTHAITSLGTLGIKQPKVLRQLTEMLELDPSDNVRKEIIKTFGSLQIADKNVLRILREREKGEGALAAEARRVLRMLDNVSS